MEVKDSQLTALTNLLESVPATELRNSLEDLFFSYLAEPNVVLPSDELPRHIYFLLLFLRDVE